MLNGTLALGVVLNALEIVVGQYRELLQLLAVLFPIILYEGGYPLLHLVNLSEGLYEGIHGALELELSSSEGARVNYRVNFGAD